jgi:hypothetical protein
LAWKIYFWLVAAALLLPLPYKLFEYATGRDASPRGIKVEEMANAAFFILGLPALYGFAYASAGYASWLWKAWVVVAVVVSIGGLVWSPKIRYARSVMGPGPTRAILAVGSLALVPMLVAVWRFAQASA